MIGRRLYLAWSGVVVLTMTVLAILDATSFGWHGVAVADCIAEGRAVPEGNAYRLKRLAIARVGDLKSFRWYMIKRVYRKFHKVSGESVLRVGRWMYWDLLSRFRYGEDELGDLWISLAFGKCSVSSNTVATETRGLWYSSLSNRELAIMVITAEAGARYRSGKAILAHDVDRLLGVAGLEM